MKSKDITLIALFAALYAATAMIPISTFIGAPSWLGLNLIITPVIALTLLPQHAFLSALIGGIISLMIAPSQAMFGPLTILLPVAGATFGSFVHHSDKDQHLIPVPFLFAAICVYEFNINYDPFIWPHFIALVLAMLSVIYRDEMPPTQRLFKLKIPLNAFISTMCEQAMMMIMAVLILQLPSAAFIGILPLMLYERIAATVGASILAVAVKKVIG